MCKKYNFVSSQVAFICDDFNDLLCMSLLGVTGCPVDAFDEAKRKFSLKEREDEAIHDFICKHSIAF